MNQVVLIGRLTKDPELRYIPGSGNAVTNFSLAVDREFKGKDGNKETDFIDIQVWGKAAENCANYLSKGSMAAVKGSIRIDNYQDQQGNNKKITRVNAERVQFLDTKNKNQNQQGNNQGYNQNQYNNQGYNNQNQYNNQGNNQGYNNQNQQNVNNNMGYDQNSFSFQNDELPSFDDVNDLLYGNNGANN